MIRTSSTVDIPGRTSYCSDTFHATHGRLKISNRPVFKPFQFKVHVEFPNKDFHWLSDLALMLLVLYNISWVPIGYRGSATTDVGSVLSMIIKLILILRKERIKNIVGISVIMVFIITKCKFKLKRKLNCI